MPVIKMALILALVFLPPSCGPTDFLNPLYTKKDLVSDPLLPGTWEGKGNDETELLELSPAEGGCYALTLRAVREDTGDSRPGEDAELDHMDFDACLVQLGQTRFLDTEPNEIAVQAVTETFKLSASPRSSGGSPFRPNIFHISDGLFVTLAPARAQDGEDARSEYELRLTPAHWIFRIWINHETLRLSDFAPARDDLATRSTRELQRLVIQHADDPDFFSSDDSLEFQRQNGGSR